MTFAPPPDGTRDAVRRTADWVQTFVRRYGWRAYAVPILTIVSVAALLNPATSPARGQARASTGSGTHSVNHPSATKPKAAASPTPVRLRTESDSTVCLNNPDATRVIVSISEQQAWMCEGRRQVNSTAVTTGAVGNGDQTPIGTWVVQGRQTNRYLVGPGYRDYVHFWVPFNGDFGFHDAAWQTMPFGSAGYVSKGSHGCVHLPMNVMSWLYGWAKPGSTVVTVQT